jgi:hypothetical protein
VNEMSDVPSLGPCCICERDTAGSVHNVIMLPFRNQVPGHGWGCVVCDMPADGATAVVCDECIELWRSGERDLAFACRGWPGTDGRMPIGELSEVFEHNRARHDE